MKKSSQFFLRLFFTLGIFLLSGVTFYLFTQQVHRPSPNTTSFIYIALSLFGFFIFLSFSLFLKWERFLFIFLSFVPLVLNLIGFQTRLAAAFLLLFLGLVLLLYLIDRKEKAEKILLQSRMESVEAECNELVNQQAVVQQRKEALLKKKRRLTLLSEAIGGASYTFSEEELAQVLMARAISLIEKGEGVELYFLKEDKQKLISVASKELQQSSFSFKQESLEPFHQWVLSNRQPLLIDDVRHEEYRFKFLSDTLKKNSIPKSLMSIPLITEDKTLGLLTFYSFSPNAYTLDDLRLLSILTSFYTLSLSNARLYHKTERLANLDGLTELVVQRHLKERLNKELYQSKQLNRSLSLLMLDLDYFKKINDQYGHLVGDAVLVKVAQTLRKFSPQEAIVSRYGGEEFSILLPGYSKKEASELAEKLRKEVEEICLEIRRKDIRVTLSGGVASFPDDGEEEEDLLSQADQLLYRAKKEGRNQIVSV